MNWGRRVAQLSAPELLAPQKRNKLAQRVSNFPKFVRITHDGDKFQRQILLLKLCLVRRQGNMHGTRCAYIYSLNSVIEPTAWDTCKCSHCLEENTEVPRCHIARNSGQVVLTSKLMVSDVQYGLTEFCHCHIHCLVSLAFYIRCDFPRSYTDNWVSTDL